MLLLHMQNRRYFNKICDSRHFSTINISVISWRSDLLVEETGIPSENHRPAASH